MLRGVLVVIALVASSFAATARADPMEDYLVQMDRLCETLSQVTDEGSARNAGVVMAEVNTELEGVQAEIAAMSDDEKIALWEAHAPEITEAQMCLSNALTPLASRSDLMAILGDGLGRMPTIE